MGTESDKVKKNIEEKKEETDKKECGGLSKNIRGIYLNGRISVMVIAISEH